MVVNAPESNILSAAEQAMALLLAQARNIPQAHAALVAGRWERSKWEGVELHGKTLGIVGLGRVGTLVAQRALAFGMRLVAYDPYVSRRAGPAPRGRAAGARRAGGRGRLPHRPPAEERRDGRAHRGRPAGQGASRGSRIVNTARGGIVDEEALAEAIASGHVGGAGLDVFDEEPTTESPLFELPSVVVTPHLGASTAEAQDKAGVTIAEQVLLALAGDFVPVRGQRGRERGRPSRCGPSWASSSSSAASSACLHERVPDALEIEFQGAARRRERTDILTLSRAEGPVRDEHRGAGLLRERPPDGRAPRPAGPRDLDVDRSGEYVNLVTLRSAAPTRWPAP